MKNKYTLLRIFSGILALIAMVLIIICMITEKNDDPLLPIALLLTGIANVTLLVINIITNRKNK